MLPEFFLTIPFPSWISDTAIPLPGPFSIKWYGLGYIAGLFLALFYTIRTCRKDDIWVPNIPATQSALIPNKRMLEDFMFFSLIGIMVGGRLGSVLLYDLDKYIKDPLAVFKVWEGGMAFHGGFLGVCVAAIYMAKSRKLRLMRMADLAAISAPFGLFLVRLANFANQELYGRVTNVAWAFRFNTDPTGRPRHPSQLYEAFLEGIVIFTVLWIASRKFKSLTKPGLSTGLFLLMYGSFRIFIENFREPDKIPQISLHITRGMAYSLPMVIIGIFVIWWAMKRPPNSPARPSE
ncbi:MAG: prolipoprotein diacylglyceryl transferase [Robiginitomaculum sp.]